MEPLTADDPRAAGEFRLRARLGAGGMGQVYLGMSPAGRAVAVKVVHPELARDTEFINRFRGEVAAAQAVNGIYTAQVVATGLYEQPPWLATAYVPGPTLQQLVDEQGPLPEPALWRLAGGLGEALQAVHAAGLVHRDLKPTNVLLAEDGPRVIDFGVSRAMDGTALTRTGLTIGTPPFMSPEQAEGKLVGPASDVFSLGSVLCFAATGAPPFGDGNAPAVLYRVVHAEPALDGIPAALHDLIAGCLAKQPAGRPALPQLIPSLAAQAEGWTGEFWPAEVTTAIRGYYVTEQLDYLPSFTPPATPATTTRSPAPRRSPLSRRRALALFGAIGGVAAAGAAVGAWQLSGSSPGRAGSKGGPHRLLWSKHVPRPVQQIALAATDVYLTLEGGAVLALAASSGQQRWYAGSAGALELAAGAGAVCWTDRGSVTAVSVSSGAKLWSKSGDVLPQVLTTADDLVAYGTASAVTVANWTSGAIQQVLPAANPTAVALADSVVFAAVDGTRITATQVSGGQLWSIGGMTGLSTTALTVAGSVLAGCGTVGAGLSVAFALDVSSGRELWQDTFGSEYNTYNAISVDPDAAVYGGNPGGSSSIGQIVKRNPGTGALGWTANIDLALGAGPLLTGTTILAGEGANVLALDSTSGNQLWQQTVDGNVTSLASDGTAVYVGTSSTVAYAFSL